MKGSVESVYTSSTSSTNNIIKQPFSNPQLGELTSECKNWFKEWIIDNVFIEEVNKRLILIDEIFANQFKAWDNSDNSNKIPIIPILELETCWESWDTVWFYAPEEDFIWLLQTAWKKAFDSIFHEWWHHLYDNEWEKKWLIFQEWYSWPWNQEIIIFAKSFLEKPSVKKIFYETYNAKLNSFTVSINLKILKLNSLLAKYKIYIYLKKEYDEEKDKFISEISEIILNLSKENNLKEKILKYKEYHSTTNEIMARIIDSLYSLKEKTDINTFKLDNDTLLFLEKFEFKWVKIFIKWITKYREHFKIKKEEN